MRDPPKRRMMFFQARENIARPPSKRGAARSGGRERFVPFLRPRGQGRPQENYAVWFSATMSSGSSAKAASTVMTKLGLVPELSSDTMSAACAPCRDSMSSRARFAPGQAATHAGSSPRWRRS